MTQVVELREAARLMRERATSATHAGRRHWRTGTTQLTKSPVVIDDPDTPSVVVETFAERYEAVNDHVAAFASPAVALAVADLLDDQAEYAEMHLKGVPYRVDADWIGRNYRAPLAVARTYLGGAA